MVRKKTILLLAGLFIPALAVPQIAFADDAPASPHTITANVGLYNQYVFRGLTQTNEKPAVQGGMDYAHSSGFYAGFWGSNISWLSDADAYTSSSLELDLYGGFRGTFGQSDFSYDAGILQYVYPGSRAPGVTRADTTELYGALGWKWITAKVSYSVSNTFGVTDSHGSYYVDLSANIPIGESGFTVGLHGGYQKFEGTDGGAALGFANNDDVFSYTDYKISLTKAFDIGSAKGFSAGVAFTDTNANDAGYTILGRNIGRSQGVVFIARSF